MKIYHMQATVNYRVEGGDLQTTSCLVSQYGDPILMLDVAVQRALRNVSVSPSQVEITYVQLELTCDPDNSR